MLYFLFLIIGMVVGFFIASMFTVENYYKGYKEAENYWYKKGFEEGSTDGFVEAIETYGILNDLKTLDK